jgi:mRNA interferase MazF
VKAPERGDICRVNFDPRTGHEQGGERPALVISNSGYNRRTGLMICLPITSRSKGYRTELPLPQTLSTSGVILTSHVYTLDWQARGVRFAESLPAALLEQAVDMTIAVIER